MKFEIIRSGTSYNWRLLDKTGGLLCHGAKAKRTRAHVEEEVFQLMDDLDQSKIIDKTAASAKITDSENGIKGASKTRAKLKLVAS